MTMTMYYALRAVGSPSDGRFTPKGACLSAEKVLIMMTKVDHLHKVLEIFFILLSGRILTLFLTKRGCIFKADRVRLSPA